MKSLKLSKSFNSFKNFSSAALPAPQINPKLPNTKLFVNNQWVDSLKPGNVFTTYNPSTGKPITDIQMSSKEDLDRAVDAARKAFHHSSPWRRMNASDRGKLLLKLADLIERDAVYLSSLDALEVGKLYYATIGGEIHYVTTAFRYMSGWCTKLTGQVIPEDGDFLCYTRYEPVGVTALISAWNYPLMFNSGKLASSLAAGNVALVKSSRFSSLATQHLIELTREAGFPDGVIGLLPGPSTIGQMMCEHPNIDLISITGSTVAGQDVYERSSKTIKRLVLALGGKSSIVVFDDVDIDKTVKHAQRAIYENSGQCCCAASKCYVHESIYEKFLERSKELARKRVIGDPFNIKTTHGPQVHEEHLNSILKMVEGGKREGATLEVGGVKCDREGSFMEPTIFSNITEDMEIAKEEIFGPVQMIIPFKTMDEVIEKVNNTRYGLASSIFTNDINKITTFTQQVQTGNVWVNCYFVITPETPFGGYKMSGLNRETGLSGIKPYVEEKCIHIKTVTKNS